MTVLEQRQERQINSRLAALTLSFTAKSSAQTRSGAPRQTGGSIAELRLDFEAFQFNLYAAHPELKTGVSPRRYGSHRPGLAADANTALRVRRG